MYAPKKNERKVINNIKKNQSKKNKKKLNEL